MKLLWTLENIGIKIKKEMEENKDKKNTLSGKLQLKKTINAGQIKQSFSHGRSRSVSVEVKKRRTLSVHSHCTAEGNLEKIQDYPIRNCLPGM